MKLYLVKVWASPGFRYKIEKNYRIERSSFGAAISEAVKTYRREIGRKKIDRISVEAVFAADKENVKITGA
jgi:hypothetical protein